MQRVQQRHGLFKRLVHAALLPDLVHPASVGFPAPRVGTPTPNYNHAGPLDGTVIFTLDGSGNPVEISSTNGLPINSTGSGLALEAGHLATIDAALSAIEANAIKGAAHHTASRITLTSSAGALAARATRVSASFYAPKGNAADVVMETSGFHISPGMSVSVGAIDAFAFTGTTGDILDVVETYN